MVDAAEQSQGGGSILPLLLLVGVFALMYFLVIRPQSQRRKQMTQMQNAVEEGAPVMTLSGLYGTVVSSEGDSVVLEVSPGVTNRYARAAIAKVLTDEEAVKAGLAPNEDAVDEDDVPVTDAAVVESPAVEPSAVETPVAEKPAPEAPRDPAADPAKGSTDRS
ncbi:preprotein translocase subunit YajC [Cryptosporangium aurantiacum]|uniref:Preprotein translocase subunit YajC n=1 Tax=Cryptosporangium aurantiacum TaxID=134849 RepID=A0A1M7RFS6_9ACTN|nr:preprotein translocase subunit YajC [Cryptosporangium aurantiacum]SHN45056.1 preprotein translocase subunit YajC [Cryptosporangium aurantiacum]